MNVVPVNDMIRLEEILKENPNMTIGELTKYKTYEINYLVKAKKLPIKSFSNAIINGYSVQELCKMFNSKEKEVISRIEEVKRINCRRERTLVLKQTINK